MQRPALFYYTFIICINTFLFIPVLFYPPVIIPLHFLITFVTYDHLLNSKKFASSLDKTTFAAIPAIIQGLIAPVIVLTFSDPFSYAPFSFVIFLYYFGVSFVEFFIIRWKYARYLKKKQID
jgi:hypothetical protein